MLTLARYALAAAALCTLTSLSVSAGERLQIKGTYSAVDKAQVLQLGKDHTFIAASNEGLGYLIEAPNDNTPLQHAAGPCGGAIEILNGRASGRGHCIRTNPSGGKWVVRWEVLPDMSKGLIGKWEVTGIEGNTVGWKGAGTWGPILDSSPGRYINQFAGWIEKP
jgi:hypothetical protein